MRVEIAMLLIVSLAVGCGPKVVPGPKAPSPRPSQVTKPSPASTPNMAVPPPDPYAAAPAPALPESFEDLLRQGSDLCVSSRYIEALPFLRKAENLNPDDPEVNLWLFIAYSETELFSDKNSLSYAHAKKVVKLYGKKSPRAKRARDFIEAVNSGAMDEMNQQLQSLGVIGRFRGVSVILVGEDFKRFYTEENITLGVLNIQGDPCPIVMTGSMLAAISIDELKTGWTDALRLQEAILSGQGAASPSPDEDERNPNEPLVVLTMEDLVYGRELGIALLSKDDRLPNGGIYIYMQDRRKPIQGVVIQPHEVSKFTALITEVESRSAKLAARTAAEERARQEKYNTGYTAGRKAHKAGQRISEEIYDGYFRGDSYARGFRDGWWDAF